MRHYLATLHQRPPHHKRRFALLTSGAFTLVIFAVWALVNFGFDKGTLADSSIKSNQEASPFASFRRGLGSSFEALRGSVEGLKTGLEVVNFSNENTIKTNAQ